MKKSSSTSTSFTLKVDIIQNAILHMTEVKY